MSRATMPIAALAALLAVAAPGGDRSALAQDQPSRSWSEEKCERYAKAWSDALSRRGTEGLGPDFVTRHEAFLASGCTARADVCPRSAQELDLANVLTIMAMSAGTASTFLPFACRG